MSLTPEQERLLASVVGRDDPDVVGVVLSGSAARGMATSRSDLDVHVVLRPGAERRQVRRSPELDEIPEPLEELEDVPAYGSEGWWFRWSFAWARVLRDDTGGRVEAAVRRLATVPAEEQRAILVDHDRLDGWVNFAYRALKSDRDGRPLETRLDAAESVPWLLDVVFTLCGRVRPYNKYLTWELREHPLPVTEWSAGDLLPQITRMLDGDVGALREVFPVVDREVRSFDPTLSEIIDAWGDELAVFR